MAGITYSVEMETQKASRAVEKFKKETANNDDALRIGRLQIQMDKERIAGNDALAKKLSSQIELEKELVAIRGRSGLVGQTDAMSSQAKERAAQREIEIDKQVAASEEAERAKRRAARAAELDSVRAEAEQKQAIRQKQAQDDAELLAKGTAANANSLKLTALQTKADLARVQGKALEAQKLEHQITLERELIRIQGLGGTHQQRDQLAQHARAQTVLADKQAEIAAAQKLANIQRGNMPGQLMSDDAKRFRMMNVSAQLQDVAVQAQMGTAMSTIVGQQAPQLISALGGTGAMAGAAAGAAISIAIVAGITQAADATHKAFQNMVSDSRTAGAEISKIISGAQNQKDIEAGLTKGAEALKTIREQEDMLYKGGAGNGFKRAMIRINEFVAGGPSIGEVGATTQKEREAQDFYRFQLNEKSLYLSNEQVKRTNMIALGNERGVAALDRRLKMEAQIFEIGMSQLGTDQRKSAEAAIRHEYEVREREIEDARKDAINESLELANADVEILKTRLSGNHDLAEELERQLKLTKEIQAINKRKDMTPEEQAAAINAISEKAQLDQQAKKEAKDNKEYDAYIEQKKKNENESGDLTLAIQKKFSDIADKERAEEAAIDKKNVDERDAAADEFLKSEEQRSKKIEERLKIDEKVALSKHRLAEAQGEFERAGAGTLEEAKAAAKVSAAKLEVEERREAQIQRAMGGSISEGAARKAERAEERSRARAERIIANRERTAKRAEMQRQGFSTQAIDKTLQGMGGGVGGIAPLDVKIEQNTLTMAKAMTEGFELDKGLVRSSSESAGLLDKILKKLTVV